MSRASGGPDTPQRNGNNIPDLTRAMLVKVPVNLALVLASCHVLQLGYSLCIQSFQSEAIFVNLTFSSIASAL